MKKYPASLFQLALVAAMSISFITACDKNNDKPHSHPQKIELTEKAAEMIVMANHFGIDLFRETALNEEGNMMLSPLSANVALTMLLNGSNGNTHHQIKQMLGYPDNMDLNEINSAYKSLAKQLVEVDKRVTLTLANAIFYRQGFAVKPPFLNAMSEAFNATIEALDFSLPASLEKINKWASDNTAKRIPKVLDEIDPSTVMFLMNALYFKGEWSSKFEKSKTNDSPFTLENGNTIQVKTMHGEVDAIARLTNDYNILEMPYGRKNFSMVVVVPHKPLNIFLREFSSGLWQEITESLSSSNSWDETMVSMPRFKFEYEKELNGQLKALGMPDAFDAALADLSGITDASVFVDFVKQNTFVEVNEEGTEAAAVTTIAITDSAPMPFMVNKPFVFVIRERTTNTLMFIGKVTDPR